MANSSGFLESFTLIPSVEDIEQNYAHRERFEPPDDLEGFGPPLESRLQPQYQKLAADEINMWISQEAHDLILFYEVGGRSYYETRYHRPCWPGGASGITIGLGYDLGYQSQEDIELAWKSRVAISDYGRLASTIGKKGATARGALQYVQDIEIPWDDAFDVYQMQTVPKYAKFVLSIYPGAELIHPHCFGALLALVYNRGSSLRGDRRLEMRNIADHIANEHYEKIPYEIRSMKRIWQGKGLDGLLKRREAEAKLFELGLAERNRVVAVPPLPDPGLRPMAMPGIDPDTLDTGIPVAPIFDATTPAPAEMASLESLHETIPPEEDGDIAYWFDEDFETPPGPLDLELERSSGLSAISWVADDALSTEYAHIRPEDRSQHADSVFDFSVADLDLLIRANRYQPLRASGKIIFGLRGAMLDGEGDDRNQQLHRFSLRLREVRPDHRNFRCVIGVYDVTRGLISGFISSTVPNRRSVYLMLTGQMMSNMLPGGCYLYEVGRHSKGKYPGCLRQAQKFVVLRNRSSNAFDIEDQFDPGFPFDNIHPAFRDGGDAGAHFSSFGCQVIRGSCVPHSNNHSGEWAKFRDTLGLSRNGDDDNGRRYSYCLFTGLDAAVASHLRQSGLDTNSAEIDARVGRLRQGSEGPEVHALQVAMGLSGPDGKLGPNTKAALVELQRQKGRPTSGVYSPAEDAALGLNVLTPKPMWPARPVTDRDFDTLDTGVPTPPIGIGADDPMVVASASPNGGTMLESARGPRPMTELDRLYLELARRSQVAETAPDQLSARRLPELESYNPESLAAAVDYGKAIFARFEHSVHDLLCGDSPDDMADRRLVMDRLNNAAGDQFRTLQTMLALLLFQKLFIIPPLNDIVAGIVVERFMKPVLSDARAAAQPYVTQVCMAWSRRLIDPDGNRSA